MARVGGEQHGAPHGELLAPVRRGVAGEDQRVVDLLHQLVGDLLTDELVHGNVQLLHDATHYSTQTTDQGQNHIQHY